MAPTNAARRHGGPRESGLRSAAVATSARATSLYQRIRNDVERRILSGEWEPGHRIPVEHELMATYGCARMTVSRALGMLAEAGLIERRRRLGSFVARPISPAAVLAIPDIEAEVRARGDSYRYELLSRRKCAASQTDREALALPEGAMVLALRCRHFAGARAFAFEERRIAIAAVPAVETVDFRIEPPGAWLLEHIPWYAAEHKISAVGADRRIALVLGIARGSACLVVERRTWRRAAFITAVRTWFPGDLEVLLTRFTPGAANATAPLPGAL